MTSTGKVTLIGGLGAMAAAAAYYFFVYRPAQLNAQAAGATIAQTVQSLTPKINQWEGKVIRAGSNIRVYLVKDGIKHLFTSPDALTKAGFTFAQVISLPQDVVDAMPTGSNLNGFNTKLLK